MATKSNNYSLGKGEVYLAAFKTGTQTPDGYRFVGNCPDFSVKVTSKTLDHFSSTGGIREKDDQATLDTERTAGITTDNLDMDNLAMFFLGESLTSILAGTVTVPTETLADIKIGYIYPLGTASYPQGARGLDVTGLTFHKGATLLVAGEDYLVDPDAGTVEFMSGGTGALADNDDVIVSVFNMKAATHNGVISGTTPFEGALRFKATQAKGKKIDFFLPWVKINPDGDYSLITESWGEMKFSVEVLKPATKEAIYADGVPVYA